MSDALAAASMINNTLHAYQIGDLFAKARSRNTDAVEIARLQALVQRLADYARYAEQQHNSLLAEAQKIDAQRCEQINAQQDEIAALRARIDALTEASTRRAEESRTKYNRLVEDYNILLRDNRALRQKSGEQP
ncbi:hypothetical protein [Acidisoma sp. 7E03]